MIITGIQKLSLLDFPGRLCCTIFTAGCNLRCPFCHNFELTDASHCENTVREDELLSFLHKRIRLQDGICVSGGEPLLQNDLPEFLKKCKDIGLYTKLDTNGFFPDKLKKLCDSGLLDYIAMDIKSSPAGYAEATGVKDIDFTRFKESIRLLIEGSVPYEFRTTVVRELHTREDMLEIAKLLHGATTYRIQSFADSDNVPVAGLSAYSEDELKEFLPLFSGHIDDVSLRGV